MNDLWMWDVRTRRVPVGFMVQGRAGTAAEWAELLGEEVNEVAKFLWPRYDVEGGWQGAAAKHMITLSEADLDLMATLRPRLQEQPVVQHKPGDDKKDKPVKATHRALFELEDESVPGGQLYPTLDLYLPDPPQWSAEDLIAVKAAIKKMSVDFGPAPLRYKELFQRPRPYQTAFMLGRVFNYEFGRSAVSPALVSGHSMQGLVRHAAAYVAHKRTLERSPGAMAGFLQHAVDYGDRRVYAGVHFPSDNIASWFCSLRLCSHIYGYAGVYAKDFMWQAIQRSALWASMKVIADTDQRHVYAHMLQRVAEEANSPPLPQEA
jgi:hypothetical protein